MKVYCHFVCIHCRRSWLSRICKQHLDIIRRTLLGVHDVLSRISVSVELFLRKIIAMLQHVHLHNQNCLNESVNKQTQELDDQRRYPLRLRKNTDFYGVAK